MKILSTWAERKLRHLLVCLLMVLMMPLAAQAIQVRYVLVKTKSGPPVNHQSVLAFLKTKAGEEFARNLVANDVRALEKTGRFSYVAVEVETVAGGVDVFFTVQPKARLRELVANGAPYFNSTKKIREIMKLTRGDLIDASELGVRIQDLKEKYKQNYFPYVSIDYEVVPVPGTKQVDVVLDVFEGKRARVRSIKFKGNEAVDKSRLRKVMTQKKKSLWKIFVNTGTYDPDNLDTDVYKIQREFQRIGYLDAEVMPPVVAAGENDKLDVEITIVQGPRYTLGTIEITGSELFPSERILGSLSLKTGDVAGLDSINAARQAVNDYYGSRGFVSTSVRLKESFDPGAPVVNLSFDVREGKLATIRDIEIRGNIRTKDKVARRELSIFPGDVFDRVRIRSSERRLRNLGYFSFVNHSIEETGEDQVYDLVFDVEEQKTGSFTAGAGISSIDDVIGFVELSQGNFDLFGPPYFTGGGQKLKLRTTLGTSRRDYELDFIEPFFLNRRLSFGLSAYQHDRRFLSDDYDQRNTGGSLSLGRPINSKWRGRVKYSLQEIDVYNVDEDASELIKMEEGKQLESAVTFSVSRDTRDSTFIARSGSITRLSAKVAGGPFGFDTDLYRLEARHNHFYPIVSDHVLNLRGYTQVVEEYGDSESVPIFSRLFLGGARTVRGFEFREIGPKDEDGEPIGGQSLLYGTAEYLIPVVTNFRFATFIDAGVVSPNSYEWELDDVNSSYGIGLRIDLPGFPLQLDYSWQLKNDEFNENDSGIFSFLIGRFF